MLARPRPDGLAPAAADPAAWFSAIWLGIGFTLLAGLALSFASGPIGAYHAATYVDLTELTKADQLLWHGRLGAIYGSDPGLLSLPLSFLVTAPLTPLLDHVHGQVGWQKDATLIAGSYVLLLGIVFLHAVRRLAWDLHLRRGAWLLQLVAVPVVLLPEFEYGHVEDVLALALVMHALRRVLRNDPVRAALLISVAIGFKQWAVMLVPFLLFSAEPGTRVRTALASAALPGALMLACIALNGGAAIHAFFSPSPSSQPLGHPGFDADWFGAHSSGVSRAAAVLVAVGAGWWYRKWSTAPRLLAVAAGILMIRPLTETVNYSYYWSPGLMMLILAAAADQGRVDWRVATPAVAAVVWAVPMGLTSSTVGWWVCQLLLVGWVAAAVSRRIPGQAELRRAPVGPAERSWPVLR